MRPSSRETVSAKAVKAPGSFRGKILSVRGRKSVYSAFRVCVVFTPLAVKLSQTEAII
jgi:hypothetical protein